MLIKFEENLEISTYNEVEVRLCKRKQTNHLWKEVVLRNSVEATIEYG